jgi:hypothetical protein
MRALSLSKRDRLWPQVTGWQGDQIGRVLAQYFRPIGECLLWAVFRKLQMYSTFFNGKSYAFCFYKKNQKMLGYILGDYFTNPSGHPVGWAKFSCYTRK